MDEKGELELEDFEYNTDQEDIFEDPYHIYITLALPTANEKDIKIKIKNDILEIKTGMDIKEIQLPAKVKKKLKKTYRNGILDIELTKSYSF
jgi:HSP20 family molecular chaperone IbpA